MQETSNEFEENLSTIVAMQFSPSMFKTIHFTQYSWAWIIYNVITEMWKTCYTFKSPTTYEWYVIHTFGRCCSALENKIKNLKKKQNKELKKTPLILMEIIEVSWELFFLDHYPSKRKLRESTQNIDYHCCGEYSYPSYLCHMKSRNRPFNKGFVLNLVLVV